MFLDKMLEDLYKSNDIHSKEYRQNERRHDLLQKQKEHRNELMDMGRSIVPLRKVFCRSRNPRLPKISLRNKIMLSEWLKGVPDDPEKWFIKPCPKGQHVLVIAVDGATKVFNKNGGFVKRFNSELPGSKRNRRDCLTILDCIYVASSQEYFVLDALAYGYQSLTDCDAEFRFFWIESQMKESNLHQVTDKNEYAFRLIEKYKFHDNEENGKLLSTYPVWPNNQPELDGFLFYHSEASYVHGRTPLVGWLFGFMIPEVIGLTYVNEQFLNERPTNYTTFSKFIEEFDNDLEQKKRDKKKKSTDRVKVETMDAQCENEPESVMKEAMALESGEADDGEFEDFEIIDETDFMA